MPPAAATRADPGASDACDVATAAADVTSPEGTATTSGTTAPEGAGHPIAASAAARRTTVPGAGRAGGTVEQPVSVDAVLDHIGPGTALVVPLANGEPTAVLDAIEDAVAADAERDGDRFTGLRVHQMHALHDRRYLRGEFGDRLRHRSYFLSPVTRPYFAAGTLDLVPSHFSEVSLLMMATFEDPLVIAAASPPDQHGYFSLGVSADYAASFIGRARFFLEVSEQMPRTFGRNQIHRSQVVGWCRSDRPLVEVPPVVPTSKDAAIAALIAERIPDGATIQTGIGAIPNAIMAALGGHRDLGVHTELLSDGVVDLIEAGVVNGVRKRLNRTKTVGTFALGTRRLYDFVHENTAIELHAARYVNDPRVIAQESDFVSINATLTVDILGQCASETIDGHYYSSSGGQADFARGARYAPGGQGYVVLHSTSSGGDSRIVPRLAAGDVVTTSKNTVDQVVTEYGIAHLRGASVAERAARLIAIAHPDHRDELTRQARTMGYL
ncbi:MAG: acetyl-CoA hydrolase/transferase family protein [Actinomycetales bacterium]